MKLGILVNVCEPLITEEQINILSRAGYFLTYDRNMYDLVQLTEDLDKTLRSGLTRATTARK